MLDFRLIDELVHYEPDRIKQLRVLRIYFECLFRGKHRWAARIKRKYYHFFDKRDDVVRAFNVGMQMAKIIKNG